MQVKEDFRALGHEKRTTKRTAVLALSCVYTWALPFNPTSKLRD